jgi:hypothetical protein
MIVVYINTVVVWYITSKNVTLVYSNVTAEETYKVGNTK